MPQVPFRTRLRRLVGGLILASLALAGGSAWAKCELHGAPPLLVTMLGMRALLPAKVNGQDVQFVVDSGAFFSSVSRATADKFKLPREPLPFGVQILGVTGDADAQVGVIDTLNLAGMPLHKMQFVVGFSEVGEGAAGLLGQNVLGLWDVDYDLAKGTINLWIPKGCEQTDMAYWAGTSSVSVIDIDTGVQRNIDATKGYVSHTMGPVYVNGVLLTAVFDTGAPATVLTLRGAARVGITPNDPGVVSAGFSSGVGKRVVPTWITPVKTFRIDQEVISNTKMQFVKVDLRNVDILVGADFFLAHHIFVSNSQHKLYLTYSGGRVFNLDQPPLQISAATLVPSDAAPAPSIPSPSTTGPADAAGFARRGDGFAARNDIASAISDLSKAVAMAPTIPDYHYQRGLIYLRNQQPFLAMADFDEALKLKPDDVSALVARAVLHLGAHETTQAVQDLEAADKASAKQDDVRLEIAHLYASADMPPAAIDQYTLWIDAHSEDSRLADALNGRCWQRALTGVDLDKALDDCNRAIRNAPKNANMLDSRGLVHLRLGDLDKAIADYDAALAMNPRLGWSLYGRGLAKQHKGLTADGAADIAAATAIDPKLPEDMKRRGLTP